MDRFADDGKLGQGFTSADDLVEVDIGSGDKPRPTFISAVGVFPTGGHTNK